MRDTGHKGMRCPECEAMGTYIIECRRSGDGDRIRRRRECDTCGHRWTTRELNEDELGDLLRKAAANEGLRAALETYVNATMPEAPKP